MRVSLSPPPCLPSHWLLLMVSSRPNNTDLRTAWRERLLSASLQGVKVVFLVAETEQEVEQERLRAEAEEFEDIVEVGVTDGHRLLGYKILAGHVWAYQQVSGNTKDYKIVGYEEATYLESVWN